MTPMLALSVIVVVILLIIVAVAAGLSQDAK